MRAFSPIFAAVWLEISCFWIIATPPRRLTVSKDMKFQASALQPENSNKTSPAAVFRLCLVPAALFAIFFTSAAARGAANPLQNPAGADRIAAEAVPAARPAAARGARKGAAAGGKTRKPAAARGGFVQEAPDYRRLTAMEYEERAKAAQKQIAIARKASNETAALNALQKGLVFVLAHPTDGTNSSLIALFRAERAALAPFWKLFYDITQDSLKSVQSSALSAAQRASHLYILENVLTYIQSLSDTEESFNKVLQLTAESKLKIPSEVHSQRLMDVGKGETISPSVRAARLLKKRRARAAKRKARQPAANK